MYADRLGVMAGGTCLVASHQLIGRLRRGAFLLPRTMTDSEEGQEEAAHVKRKGILDYLMPNMTGEQTAKWIHLVDPGAHIIAVSGDVHEPPSWAEAFVRKTDVVELIQLPETLMAQASRGSDHIVSG